MGERSDRHTNEYVMESEYEAQRLELKTRSEETEKQLTLVGLRPGMVALDAGCGTGAVARVMSKIVGPGGSVTAVDRSGVRLAVGRRLAAQEKCENVVFAQADLAGGCLVETSFDLVWCRFVFEYLDEPDAVLHNLVRAARIGGKVVVADLDGNGQFHYPMSDELERGMAVMLNAMQGRLDPYAGRKLYYRYRKQAMGDVRVHLLPYHTYGEGIPEADMANWQAKFDTLETLGEAAFGSRREYRSWVAEFLRHLMDPDVFTYSILVVVEGVRLK